MAASPQNNTGGLNNDAPLAIAGVRPVGRDAGRRRILARQEENVSDSAIAVRRWPTHQYDTCNSLCTPLELYDIRLREFVVERVRCGPIHQKGSRCSATLRYMSSNLDPT